MLSDTLTEIDLLLESLTVLFPGFLAYFIYVGLRTEEFEQIKKSHIVLILFFTLLFQIVDDLSGVWMDNPFYLGIYYFVLPVLVGVISDVVHRLFVTVGVRMYQESFINQSDHLKLIDVGNVTRWQKTVSDYVELGEITREYYVEVELSSDSENAVKRGFLNGYSDDDIEIIRYDDLSEKTFQNVGTPDVDDDKLTLTVELIPRSEISTLRIYRVRMEDFELE